MGFAVAAQPGQFGLQLCHGIGRLVFEGGHFVAGGGNGGIEFVQRGIIQPPELQGGGGGGAVNHLHIHRAVRYGAVECLGCRLRLLDAVFEGFNPCRPLFKAAVDSRRADAAQGGEGFHRVAHRPDLFARHAQVVVDVDGHLAEETGQAAAKLEKLTVEAQKMKRVAEAKAVLGIKTDRILAELAEVEQAPMPI